MSISLSRRRKGIVVTVLITVAIAAVGLAVLFLTGQRTDVYVPGEPLAGITRTLGRSTGDDIPAIRFEDVAAEAGVDFSHFPSTRTSRLPEDMGSGVAWGDFDDDGWQDLFLANIAGPVTIPASDLASSPAHNALYRNLGGGKFEDVSLKAGVDLRCWCSGAAWGDYDRDGRLDLFVTAYGENSLYRNLGDGRFEETAVEAGVGGVTGFWTGASWSDYDRDGRLDLYVTGYVRFVEGLSGKASRQYDVESPVGINPSSYAPERNLLYHNLGNGRFEEVGLSAGVANVDGRSLSAAWADFDDDGWPDLYVANDVSDNVLFRNTSTGVFEDVSHAALVADYRGAMGLAVADWDGDQDLDLFITHWIAQENALYSNRLKDVSGRSVSTNGAVRIRFIDVADRYGLGQSALDFVGWGTFFFDYDNDGRPDLFIANGSTLQMPGKPQELIPMTDMLLWNGGPKRGFYDVAPSSGDAMRVPNVGRGAAFADFDNDGDLDIAVSNHGGKAALLMNMGQPANNWLAIRLRGVSSNLEGIGARIRVVAGDSVAVQEVGSQASYLSQSSRLAHFGLNKCSRVDSVEVQWPSGHKSVLTGVQVNQIITIHESS